MAFGGVQKDIRVEKPGESDCAGIVVDFWIAFFARWQAQGIEAGHGLCEAGLVFVAEVALDCCQIAHCCFP